MQAPTVPTKEVRYDRETEDYAYLLNGEVVGWAATHRKAEQALDELVYMLLSRPGGVDASELTADEAEAMYVAQTVELAELERQSGVVDAQPVAVRAFLPATAKDIAAAVAAARQAAQTERTINAINRAYQELLTGAWLYTGSHLVVRSRTRPNQRHYVTAEGCDCEAWGLGGKICWHRAAWLIVSTVAAPESRA